MFWRPPRFTFFPYTTLFRSQFVPVRPAPVRSASNTTLAAAGASIASDSRSEEHTSELQSLRQLVCRLLLEKKKTALASIKLIQATAVLALTEYHLDFLTSNK